MEKTPTLQRAKVPVTMASVGLLYVIVFLLVRANDYYLQILSLVCINVMMAVSLNLINGYTGQFSIGHAGFMGVGAYVAGALTSIYRLPFPVALLAGGVGASIIGVIVGLPTLRLRGDYLAIATLGFGEIIRVTINNIESVGGPRGLLGIPPYTSFPWAFALAAATTVIVVNFVNSAHGRACKAIREDEVAAEAMGINTTYYKVLAFTAGSFFAGLAGGLLVHLYCLAHPTMFSFMKSVDYLIMIVLGGYGSTTGAVLSAALITMITEALRRFQEWRLMAYALLLIVIMITRPKGLLGGKELSYGGVISAITSFRGERGRKECGL